MGKMATGALLMCSVLVLVAVAPLAQSNEAVHLIEKWENGPPSTCNVSWTFEAPSDGTWQGLVVDDNDDMRWIIIHVEDTTVPSSPVVVVDREMYRFAVYDYDDFLTDPVDMEAGHSYEITVTPNCPLDAWCTVEDIFTGVGPIPPVAIMDEVEIDYLSVSVDGSASYDDGSIVSYLWDFGDGTTASGATATHTYSIPEVPYIPPGSYGDPLVFPYFVKGHTMDAFGDPLPYSTVIVTNTFQGEEPPPAQYCVVESDIDGYYVVDLVHAMPTACVSGDVIKVRAVNGALSGESTGVVTLGTIPPQITLDVTLGENPIEPFQMIITLTVTDNDGLYTSVTEPITLPGGA